MLDRENLVALGKALANADKKLLLLIHSKARITTMKH